MANQDREKNRRPKPDGSRTFYSAMSNILFLGFGFDVAASARFSYIQNFDNVDSWYKAGMIASIASIVLGILLKFFLTCSTDKKGRTSVGCCFSFLDIVLCALTIAHTTIFILGLKFYNDCEKGLVERCNSEDVLKYYIVNQDVTDHKIRCGCALAASVLYLVSLVLSCCMSVCGKGAGN